MSTAFEPFEPFKIEQRGVDAVPRAERTRNWWDLFVIQAGINITLPSFLIGALLVPALSWAQAVAALVLGNVVVGILMVLTGHLGVDHGIPTTVASRFSLGYPRGMWLSSMCVLVSLVGWFAVTAELAGLAVDHVLKEVFGWSSPRLVIVLMALSNSLPAVAGFASIRWLSALAVPGLLALSAWLLGVIVTRYGYAALVSYAPAGGVAFTTAIDWVIGGFIVGVFTAPDVSRYVRARWHNWVGGLAGVVPASVLLGLIGALAKLATGDWNAVNAVETLGLGIPALLIVVFATWTTNDVNLYSSGLALTNLRPSWGRWRNTLVLSLLGTTLAALRISNHFEKFLTLLSYAFSPLVGVLLTDYYFVRRGRLDVEEAYQERGRYSYLRGVNETAVLAVVAGILAGVLTPSRFVGSLISLGLAGALYYAAMRLRHPEHFPATIAVQADRG